MVILKSVYCLCYLEAAAIVAFLFIPVLCGEEDPGIFRISLNSSKITKCAETASIRNIFEAGRPITIIQEALQGDILIGSGSQVLVGLFHFPPFTYEKTEEDGTKKYSGVEVTLVRAVFSMKSYFYQRIQYMLNSAQVTSLAESLGLTPLFRTPSDGVHHWGNSLPNGSANGLFRDIASGAVDVGIGEYFRKPNKRGFMDPSEHYMFDHFCFVRRRPGNN